MRDDFKVRRERIRRACACRDCGKHGGLFMLKSKLWREVAPECPVVLNSIGDPDLRHFMLCIRCVEGRLGRRLVSGDFMPGVPCNDVVFYFARKVKVEDFVGGWSRVIRKL